MFLYGSHGLNILCLEFCKLNLSTNFSHKRLSSDFQKHVINSTCCDSVMLIIYSFNFIYICTGEHTHTHNHSDLRAARNHVDVWDLSCSWKPCCTWLVLWSGGMLMSIIQNALGPCWSPQSTLLQKLCWSPWSKSKEVFFFIFFGVVWITANTHLRMKDIVGFCDNAHRHQKKESS